MYFVYILQSRNDNSRQHIGMCTDLKLGIEEHNSGKVPETVEDRPWQLETALYFRDKKKAQNFEKYLNTKPGEEFKQSYL